MRSVLCEWPLVPGTVTRLSAPEMKSTSSGELTATCGELEICYETFGSSTAPPMLLVMGLASQMLMWDEQFCEQLAARGYFVIRFDNRDIGRSSHLKGAVIATRWQLLRGSARAAAYTLDEMAQDGVGLLDHLGIGSAHVVGVSMGGMIAQLVAADHPEHVLSLTSIMSTSGNPAVPFPADPGAIAKMPPAAPGDDQEAIITRAVKMIQVMAGPDYPPDEKRIRDLVVRSMKRSADRAGMARHNAVSALGLREDRRPKLRTIKVPTVVVHGAKDPLMSVEGGKDTAANIPGAELRIIPGMGHDLPIPLVNTIADAVTAAAARATGPKAAAN
jgi:pimeloyl-ACP methyl ester carboxylesterase